MNLIFIKKKPYLLLLFTSLSFLIYGFVQKNNIDDTIDINIHDTYFVIAHSYLMWFLSIAFFTFYCIYFTFEKTKFSVNKKLSVIHIYSSIITLIGICFPMGFIFPQYLNQFDGSVNAFIAILSFLFLIAQILLLINFCIGTYKKCYKKTL